MAETLAKEVKLKYPIKVPKGKDGIFKIIDTVSIRKFKVKDLKKFPKHLLTGQNAEEIGQSDISEMIPLLASVCEIDTKNGMQALTEEEIGEMVIDDLFEIVKALDTSSLGLSNPLA
jgi:hypothetical protein